ncbi:DUF423 domain-containing protein [Legionella cherrii]|uniref:Protein of uncharacterized function (DUF423) n=1 Tax=Legionella cherrii TaxID=28084 RepID=A0A0W0S9M9_9GAMM|nr:DUF423 domain-containing protein [Legionella cherrii]KTC79825.1 hypothetical protein Lche_1845 [Legionella cherrii]VEB38056.1 Protein of uncharacterised function (DUF423) [Legionella cherrii]
MNINSTVLTSKRFITLGALLAMVATILGAFAAHVLKTRFSDLQMDVFKTGVFYQMIHSLALLFDGMLLVQFNNRFIQISGWLFLAGIFFFSGSLYLLSLCTVKAVGLATPIGGLFFIFGWFLLAIGIHKA